MNIRKLFLMAATVSLCIPNTSWSQSKTPTPKTKLSAKRKLLDPANMDLSVNPGDNFFFYGLKTTQYQLQKPVGEALMNCKKTTTKPFTIF